MADDQKDQIEQRLDELPENIRNAVLSAETGKHIREIGQRHNLHIDQLGKLEDETMLVMLGFFDPDAFNIQLEEQLLISVQDAAAVAKDVSDEIFMPIRDSLKRFMADRHAAPAQAQPQASAPTVPTAPAPVSTPVKINTPPPATPPVPLVVAVPPPVIPVAPVMPPPMPAAEKMLTEQTTVKPIYKTDPYREPIE